MTIDVNIFSRNMEVTERIHNYVTKKVSKLDRYLNEIDEARVDLAYIKSARNANDRQVAQITIRGRGFILRSEERADDIFAALDIALDRMQRRIERFKGKRSRSRIGNRTEFESEPIIDIIEDGDEPVIARRKKFLITPMNEIEAIDQMELLGHEEFFVFFNADTNSINVLYRRRDRTYGLIETEIA